MTGSMGQQNSRANEVGLCADCRHMRTVETPRSRFYQCGLSLTDSSFPKYPRLPVVQCRGYEQLKGEPAAQ
jgi:hypothetical protein